MTPHLKLSRSGILVIAVGLLLAAGWAKRSQADASAEAESDLSWRILEVRDNSGNSLPGFPAGFTLTVFEQIIPGHFIFEEFAPASISFSGVWSVSDAGVDSQINLNSIATCLAPSGGQVEGTEVIVTTIDVYNNSAQTVTLVMEFASGSTRLNAARQNRRESAEASAFLSWSIPAGLSTNPWSSVAVNCPPPWDHRTYAFGGGLVSLSPAIDAGAGNTSSTHTASCVIAVTIPSDSSTAYGGLIGSHADCKVLTPLFFDGFED